MLAMMLNLSAKIFQQRKTFENSQSLYPRKLVTLNLM